MNRFLLIEHTADMGIEAQGESLAALFQQAALGLRQVMTSCSDINCHEEILVEVRAQDLEELLVNWLTELIYLLETRRLLPAEILIESISACRLKARVKGEIFDAERHFLEREVKAITYHQIRVEEVAAGWWAQVFVDI